MLKIGKTNSLEVVRTVPMGLILAVGEDEVLLPRRYVPAGAEMGDVLDVFVYTDSEDRPIATTQRPIAEADQFAALRVISVSRIGAFLDWGLPKDLLLPFRFQTRRVQPGDSLVVRILFDEASRRPVATARVERFLESPPDDVREGREVEILAYEDTDLGIKAIVEGHYPGLLYHERGKLGPEIGSTIRGFVQRVRPDGKIDLSLEPSGKAGIDASRQVVLDALRANDGRIELGDRSDPGEIRRVLGLSKKAFKRAAGGLYRDRLVRISEDFIESIDGDSNGS